MTDIAERHKSRISGRGRRGLAFIQMNSFGHGPGTENLAIETEKFFIPDSTMFSWFP